MCVCFLSVSVHDCVCVYVPTAVYTTVTIHTPSPHLSQLKELEKEHMTELGTSITKTQDVEPERSHCMTSRAGDLLSSTHLDKRQSVRTRRQSKGDFGEH